MFAQEVLDAEQEMIDWRRRLHQFPELSFHEFETTAFLEEQLRSFGSVTVRRPTKTGLVAGIVGLKPGEKRILGIRADIDALPMPEENDLPYRSQRPNVMHACGHDGHAAMLLMAAKLLSAHRDSFCGEVRLLFQHAEELPPGGAIELAQAGAADGVDWMLGLHLSSNYPTGVFGIRSGALTANVDSFRITVVGKGGHCAFPEQTVDPIVAASQIILALQTVVSRKIAANDAAVISVCKVSGGTAYNIIPDAVVLEGAVRSFLPETRECIQQEIKWIAESTAKAAHAACEVQVDFGYPSVVNDPVLTQACSGILQKRFGMRHVKQIERIMPGEDFAYFTEGRPGFFVELGTRCHKKLCDRPHHNSGYRLDEDALKFGLQYYLNAITTLLDGSGCLPREGSDT